MRCAEPLLCPFQTETFAGVYKKLTGQVGAAPWVLAGVLRRWLWVLLPVLAGGPPRLRGACAVHTGAHVSSRVPSVARLPGAPCTARCPWSCCRRPDS